MALGYWIKNAIANFLQVQWLHTVPAKSVRTRALFWTFLHWVLRRRVPSADREIGLKYVSKAIKFYSFADKITSYRVLIFQFFFK